MCCWRDDIREIERRVKYLWPNQMRGRREPWQKQRNLDSNDPSFLVRFSPPVAVYCRFVCLHLLCDQNVWSLWESWAGLSMFLSSYIYIYTQTRNNFRKEILRNDKFINLGNGIRIKRENCIPFLIWIWTVSISTLLKSSNLFFLSLFFYFIR